jgi:hypothetical protein
VLRPLLWQWARVARGIEMCLRIGSSFPEPKNPCMMVSYLSYDDLVELVRCALFTPRVDHSIFYGVSDNTVKWWDNARAAHIGFHAGDSSRRFEDRFLRPARWMTRRSTSFRADRGFCPNRSSRDHVTNPDYRDMFKLDGRVAPVVGG